jgi:predicted small secreted protein
MMRHRVLVVAVSLGCTFLVGCHRSNTSGCEDTRRYAKAASASPVQIPDDLTPPSETDALRLPPVVANNRAPTQPCLEDPPAFSEQIRLGGRADPAKSGSGAGEAPETSRRERRQQRRHPDESK